MNAPLPQPKGRILAGRWQQRIQTQRGSNTAIGQWWWTIDRWLLTSFVSLMIVSAVIVTASSPPVAKRIGFESHHFIVRQMIFLVISGVCMMSISMMQRRTIRRLATLGLSLSLIAMILLPLLGADAKGATRWLKLGGLSLQPSEFMKPCFVIVIAWLLAEKQKMAGFPAYRIAVGLFLFTTLLLVIQPDVGMMLTLTMIFAVQLFLSGIPLYWVLLLGVSGMMALVGAYLWFPHVANRINGFLDASSVDNYQVQKSLEAFASGGLLGKGPGEGDVKWSLPDAHTDFVFAVIGEEFGLFVTLLTAMVFAAIVIRGLYRAAQAQDTFLMLAITGLATQIGLQAFINMGVAVHLLPAKGMTLPFLSYGGSSLLAISLTAGAMLGLTRRQYGALHRPLYSTWRTTL